MPINIREAVAGYETTCILRDKQEGLQWVASGRGYSGRGYSGWKAVRVLYSEWQVGGVTVGDKREGVTVGYRGRGYSGWQVGGVTVGDKQEGFCTVGDKWEGLQCVFDFFLQENCWQTHCTCIHVST